MTNLRWSGIRIILLSLTLFGLLGVLLKVILFPTEEKKQLTSNFVFPDIVPLSGWQQKETIKLKTFKATPLGPGLAPGQLYKYVNNQGYLEVEGRYEQYKGNINRYIVIYRNMPPATLKPRIKYKKDLGYYGVFEDKDKVFLSACVNPKGESTATENQFSNNRFANGWGIQRTFLWIIGQQDLFDGRCLWTIMSVPITNYDPYQITLEKDLEDEYQKLETAWVEWYQWWKANLPSY